MSEEGTIPRRVFLKKSTIAVTTFLINGKVIGEASPEAINQQIQENRPTRLKKLSKDLLNKVGSTHVAGKYHLTKKPFLIEGAEKLLELGTRLGKFWFIPRTIESSYPFNSNWGKYGSLLELARSEYFRTVFEMPFNVIILEAHSPAEESWRRANLKDDFYKAIGKEFYELTAHLYKTYRNRDLIFIIQHWEGDWLLRGRAGELWKQPPQDWMKLCKRAVKWLSARQEGVRQARKEFGKGAKCVVAHSAEVNRVTDIWINVPTLTQYVLPEVELDLVSYSSYDGMKDPLTMWRCIEEIKKRARTGSLFGKSAIYIGEIGIPENKQPNNIQERWDNFMGVFLAQNMKFVVQWELYCNEIDKQASEIKLPITDPSLMRGFWLVKPDGTLSESGKYFTNLWKRASE